MRALLLDLVEKPAAKDSHGLGLVLVLAALVAAIDHQPAGQVGDPHAALGLVLVLSARPSRTHDVDLEVLGADVDLHVLGLGKNGDRRRGGMDSPLGLRLGNALDPMTAAFKLEMAKNALAGKAERDLAETSQLGRLHVHDFKFPAHALGEPPVHLVQVAANRAASSPPVPARISMINAA